MSGQLQDKIHTLAGEFVEAMLAAIRGASLEDLSEGSSEGLNIPVFGAPKAGKTSKDPGRVGSKFTAAGTPAARSPKAKPTGRLARRSKEDIAKESARVAALLVKSGGLRSEHIQKALSFDKRELPRILREGVASGVLKVVSGQKRSTLYGAGSGRKPAATAKKASKKASKKPVAKKASSKKPSKKPATKKPVAKKAPAKKQPSKKTAPKPSGKKAPAKKVKESPSKTKSLPEAAKKVSALAGG